MLPKMLAGIASKRVNPDQAWASDSSNEKQHRSSQSSAGAMLFIISALIFGEILSPLFPVNVGITAPHGWSVYS
jgi:hypothetical protein